jgi:single-strand DNA-binding protein
MAGSVNKVILVGNVGKDPEIRSTQTGMKIANITLATSESWKDKASGERKERTEWHRISVMNDGLSGVVERFVHKGSKIYVEGQLQTRKWTDKDGNDKYSTEVVLGAFNGTLVLLDGKRDDGQSHSNGNTERRPAAQTQQRSSGPSWDAPKGVDLDDEIPF